MLEALRLQAEAKFLGGTPAHRRAIGALDNATGETNRVGLIIAWPERATVKFPESLQDANFIPDAAAIAALLDGLRPTEPILYADPVEGSVTIALSHANGAVLRATREDVSSRSTFTDGISRVTRETAVAYNHTPAFTDALIESLQHLVLQHSFDTPILILPNVVTQGASSHLKGVPSSDSEWWSKWGIVVGGLLVATGSLQTLATMQLHAEELNPTVGERFITICSDKTVAMKLVIAAILVLAIGPTILSGLKLALLDVLNPELNSQHSQTVETRKQQIVYKELGKSAWPMTKITADVINNVPIGIDIDSVRINVGEPISIRGRAINTDGKSAAELIARMQENLQSTGMFKDIQFSYDTAGIYGDREFDLWATVVRPLKRPRYSTEEDFGRWTYAMRKAGLDPEEATDHIEVPMATGIEDNGSPLNEANHELRETGNETPIFVGDTEEVGRVRVAPPTNGGSSASSHSDNPNFGGNNGPRIPEPLDPAQIKLMSEDEARIALTDVTEGLQHVSRSDADTKKRLRNEMRLLLDRLKETQR